MSSILKAEDTPPPEELAARLETRREQIPNTALHEGGNVQRFGWKSGFKWWWQLKWWRNSLSFWKKR
jgi:hypothetical protein